ncbi:MAG: CD225/dispanin family protein [Candidatus Nanopelagicales bacterium]
MRSHLAWAVVSTLLCFAPTGVAAVVFAARVQPLLAADDVAGARRASKIAKRLCLVSLALTVLFVAVIAAGVDGYAAGPTGP